MTATLPSPSAKLADGVLSEAHSRMHGRVLHQHENVLAHGADRTGVADSTSAIQAAINTVLHGGQVYFPAGRYKITAPLTIGSDQEINVEGVQLMGAGSGGHVTTNTLYSSTIIEYAGSSGDAAMLDIFNARNGGIHNIAFHAKNLAASCVRFRHAGSGQPANSNEVEHWDVTRCTFNGARTYNVQIGSTAAIIKDGNVSLVAFRNCFFRPDTDTSAQTTAHVYQRSSNALTNSFLSCQFYGNGTYPANGILMESGSMDFFGCQSVILGVVDLKLIAASGDVPPIANVYGWESQSKRFLLYDSSGSLASGIRPMVLSGVVHSDIEGTGTYTINWNTSNIGTHGPLYLAGFKAHHDINLNTSDFQKTYVNGVSFQDNGADFIGAGASRISGSWNVGQTRKSQFAGTVQDAVLSPSTSAGNGLIVRGVTSQSANIQNWEDSNSAVLAYVAADGSLNLDKHLKTGASTTGNRPSAAAVGAGAQRYDTTLGMPIWSNGSVWKDAAGNTV